MKRLVELLKKMKNLEDVHVSFTKSAVSTEGFLVLVDYFCDA